MRSHIRSSPYINTEYIYSGIERSFLSHSAEYFLNFHRAVFIIHQDWYSILKHWMCENLNKIVTRLPGQATHLDSNSRSDEEIVQVSSILQKLQFLFGSSRRRLDKYLCRDLRFSCSIELITHLLRNADTNLRGWPQYSKVISLRLSFRLLFAPVISQCWQAGVKIFFITRLCTFSKI